MSKKPFSLWTDRDICDWFDDLDEDYIRSLIDLHGDHDLTPRKAFHYVFGDLDSQHCTCHACKLSLSPVPAQQSQSESVAAPAEVGQGQGTITLEQFQRWMEDKAHAAYSKVSGSYGYPTSEDLAYALIVAECRAVTKLLMQFKLEQGV